MALSGGGANPFTAAGSALDPILLEGHSADEVMDAVVEAIRPVDGTQDAEANRAAIRDALSEVLTVFPNADLLDLEEQHRELAIELFVSLDIFRRIDLDLGKTIRDKAPTATIGLGRLKEIREYIKEAVAESFRKMRNLGKRMAVGRITEIVQGAIRDTLQVFEGYTE